MTASESDESRALPSREEKRRSAVITSQAATRGAHKVRLLVGFLAITLLALVGGGTAPRAGADTCRHTDVVLYTTDTVRLATELGKSASACADYFISITP